MELVSKAKNASRKEKEGKGKSRKLGKDRKKKKKRVPTRCCPALSRTVHLPSWEEKKKKKKKLEGRKGGDGRGKGRMANGPPSISPGSGAFAGEKKRKTKKKEKKGKRGAYNVAGAVRVARVCMPAPRKKKKGRQKQPERGGFASLITRCIRQGNGKRTAKKEKEEERKPDF